MPSRNGCLLASWACEEDHREALTSERFHLMSQVAVKNHGHRPGVKQKVSPCSQGAQLDVPVIARPITQSATLKVTHRDGRRWRCIASISVQLGRIALVHGHGGAGKHLVREAFREAPLDPAVQEPEHRLVIAGGLGDDRLLAADQGDDEAQCVGGHPISPLRQHVCPSPVPREAPPAQDLQDIDIGRIVMLAEAAHCLPGQCLRIVAMSF
mmetsp:Transcript_23988/g.68724  ORF Transcript_23988/g.68724 Transcript_23988/m.68724 type:complete len:211 (-) Transcript_23988:716-1348(-)